MAKTIFFVILIWFDIGTFFGHNFVRFFCIILQVTIVIGKEKAVRNEMLSEGLSQ